MPYFSHMYTIKLLRQYGISLALILLQFSHFSCTKELLEPTAVYSSLGEGKHLRSIHFVSDNEGFIAGGNPGNYGFIFHTADGGNTWQLLLETGWCLYDVDFLDSKTGCVCGDSLKIMRTTDGGNNWNPVQLSWFPDPEFIVPLKHIEYADDTTWYFCGGDQYKAGVNIRTQDGGGWWDMQVFQASLNTSFFRDANRGVLAGYGVVLMTQDANVSFSYSTFDGDNLTGLTGQDTGELLACGYDGGIYRIQEGGLQWETLLNPNGILGSRIHFNAIVAVQQAALAVGNSGLAYFSSDGGANWSETELPSEEHLLAVTYYGGRYWIVGQDGVVINILF